MDAGCSSVWASARVRKGFKDLLRRLINFELDGGLGTRYTVPSTKRMKAGRDARQTKRMHATWSAYAERRSGWAHDCFRVAQGRTVTPWLPQDMKNLREKTRVRELSGCSRCRVLEGLSRVATKEAVFATGRLLETKGIYLEIQRTGDQT